jgi:fermentation-respiration switch protein FrsA (DUF1100 family)
MKRQIGSFQGLISGGMCPGVLILLILTAGCTAGAPEKAWFSVDRNGVLSLKVPPPTVSETVIFNNGNLTKSRVVFRTEDSDIVTYLTAAAQPKAAIIFVPGVGEKAAGHDPRMAEYAQRGYAFLYLDPRGNGGETKGTPPNIQNDYRRYEGGQMPQYYQIVSDVLQARAFLERQYHVPVYAVGSSNGGRYAAIAAAIDPVFAGYAGISTSGFDMAGSGYTGETQKFLLSIDPDTYIARIAPRPVLIFHAPDDPIIPFAQGEDLFARAQEPKRFIAFNGTHGINDEVDRELLVFLDTRT